MGADVAPAGTRIAAASSLVGVADAAAPAGASRHRPVPDGAGGGAPRLTGGRPTPQTSGGRTTPRAEDLQIAGVVPLNSTDWPDHLCATLYLQGCPWSCTYCQNVAIIDPQVPGQVAWAEVEELLGRRRGLLDGVVFSGGEATRQGALIPALARVRELGFGTGLHTAGAYPHRLAAALPLLDWVGLDLKALPEHYGAVAGRGARGTAPWQCLELALDAGVGLEVRTTIYPGSVAAEDVLEVARRARGAGAPTFALQEARVQGTAAQFEAGAAAWDAQVWRREWGGLVEAIGALGFETFHVRAA